jgi:hypothetical protein
MRLSETWLESGLHGSDEQHAVTNSRAVMCAHRTAGALRLRSAKNYISALISLRSKITKKVFFFFTTNKQELI